MKDRIKSLIDAEVDAIRKLPITDDFKMAVDMIYHFVHRCKSKLIVSGIGKAGQIGLNIATTFSSTGTCAVYLHPTEAQHGDLGILQDGDIMLLLSNSGKTREVIELIDLAKKICPGLVIITIT